MKQIFIGTPICKWVTYTHSLTKVLTLLIDTAVITCPELAWAWSHIIMELSYTNIGGTFRANENNSMLFWLKKKQQQQLVEFTATC